METPASEEELERDFVFRMAEREWLEELARPAVLERSEILQATSKTAQGEEARRRRSR